MGRRSRCAQDPHALRGRRHRGRSGLTLHSRTLRLVTVLALGLAFFAWGRVAGASAAAPAMSELDYVTRTTAQTVNTTPTAVVASSSLTLDGSTPIVVHFDAYAVQAPGTSGAALILELFDGSTSVGKLAGIV